MPARRASAGSCRPTCSACVVHPDPHPRRPPAAAPTTHAEVALAPRASAWRALHASSPPPLEACQTLREWAPSYPA
eukprot:2399070-Prymnesium_polylepis.1